MWNTAKKQIADKNKKLKCLRNKVTKLKKRVHTLKSLITHLKKSNRISHDCEFLLNVSFIRLPN